MKYHPLLASLAVLVLAACSGGPGGPRSFGDRAERPRLEPIGDPGSVAAREVEFALAAREEGQWTAFRRFAASDALLHGPDGPFSAGAWLASQTDPAEAVRWVPREVYSSCDGTLAVSFGRFQEPEGTVGSYVTVWALQSDGEYKWSYDMGAPDNPQPPPPPPDFEPDENTIVVTELPSIIGRVAECVPTDRLPPYRQPIPDETTESVAQMARDGTLAWRWEHHAGGLRRVVVDYLRDGEWQQALEFTIAAGNR